MLLAVQHAFRPRHAQGYYLALRLSLLANLQIVPYSPCNELLAVFRVSIAANADAGPDVALWALTNLMIEF